MNGEPIVAIGLLTRVHLQMLGASLKQVYPIDRDGSFDSLIAALDEAQRQNSPEPPDASRQN